MRLAVSDRIDSVAIGVRICIAGLGAGRPRAGDGRSDPTPAAGCLSRRANSGLMQYSKDGACDLVTPALARISCEPDSFRRITRHYTARGQEA